MIVRFEAEIAAGCDVVLFVQDQLIRILETRLNHIRKLPRILLPNRMSQLLSEDHSSCHPDTVLARTCLEPTEACAAHTLPLGGFVNQRVHSCIRGCLTLKLLGSWKTVTFSPSAAAEVEPFGAAFSSVVGLSVGKEPLVGGTATSAMVGISRCE